MQRNIMDLALNLATVMMYNFKELLNVFRFSLAIACHTLHYFRVGRSAPLNFGVLAIMLEYDVVLRCRTPSRASSKAAIAISSDYRRTRVMPKHKTQHSTHWR